MEGAGGRGLLSRLPDILTNLRSILGADAVAPRQGGWVATLRTSLPPENREDARERSGRMGI
jgi:hypothetical protein